MIREKLHDIKDKFEEFCREKEQDKAIFGLCAIIIGLIIVIFSAKWK